jgi:hypothetical protein
VIWLEHSDTICNSCRRLEIVVVAVAVVAVVAVVDLEVLMWFDEPDRQF